MIRTVLSPAWASFAERSLTERVNCRKQAMALALGSWRTDGRTDWLRINRGGVEAHDHHPTPHRTERVAGEEQHEDREKDPCQRWKLSRTRVVQVHIGTQERHERQGGPTDGVAKWGHF